MTPSAPSVESILAEAVEIPDTAARAAYLDRACGPDPALRGRVERLVADHFRAGSFLERPPVVTTPDATAPFEPGGNGAAVGDAIGPYKLRELIGEGGMGAVYVADQEAPVRRRVALKVIKPGMDSKQVAARFEAERQALALMDHPGIAKVLDGGSTESGRPFFVMELVRGLPITDYCDRAALPTRDRLALFAQVCRAVQHAHQKGVIHRDIKPGNVLVTSYDAGPVPKVIDFGIAKAVGPRLADATIYTGHFQLVGTPLYMSPEQADLTAHDVDTRSDVYSLGVLLYELLTGTTPFDAETLQKAGYDEMRRIIREDEPPRPSKRLTTLDAKRAETAAGRRGADPRRLARQVRGELDWVVMRALDKDRARRYQSPAELAADVERYLAGQAVEAAPPSAWYGLRKFARRNRAAVLAGFAGLAVLGAVAGSAGYVVRDRAARAEAAGQKVAEALAGVRAAAETGDLNLADRRVAEARGHLGADTDRLSAEAAAVEEAERDLAARRADADRLAKFLRLAADAQDKMGYGQGLGGERVAEEALGLYGVLGRGDWPARLDASTLTAAQKGLVREAAYVTLVSLADFHVRWKPLRDDTQSVARSLDLLKRAEAFHELTRAFYFVRGECHRLRKDEAAAEADRQRYEAAEARSAWDHYLPGHTAGWRGDIDAAIRAYRAALRVQPDHYASLFFLALRLSEKKGDPAAAAWLLTGCIALRPNHIGAYINRAVCYRKLGQLGEAEADFSAAVATAATEDNRIHALNARAAFYTATGRPQEARRDQEQLVAAHRAATRLNPASAAAHANLGTALWSTGRPDEAIAAVKEALRLDPNHARAYVALGQALRDKGRPDEAVAASREAVRLDPNDAEAHNNLGSLLCDVTRDYDGAAASFRAAVRLQPNAAIAHYNLGVALRDKGRPEEAVASFKEALRLEPSYAEAHNNLGSLLCDVTRDYDGAAASFRAAIRLRPNNASYHSNLGNALLGRGDRDAAVAAYREATRLKPDSARAHRALGNGLDKLGRPDEAIACFRKAVAIDPKYGPAHNGLAWRLANHPDVGSRDPREAIEHAHTAVELEPREATFWNTLGVAHYRNDDWARAIDALTKSTSLPGGEESTNFFFLAMAHWQLGDEAEARTWYVKAVAWMDKNKPRDEELRRFRTEAAALLGREVAPPPRGKDSP